VVVLSFCRRSGDQQTEKIRVSGFEIHPNPLPNWSAESTTSPDRSGQNTAGEDGAFLGVFCSFKDDFAPSVSPLA